MRGVRITQLITDRTGKDKADWQKYQEDWVLRIGNSAVIQWILNISEKSCNKSVLNQS